MSRENPSRRPADVAAAPAEDGSRQAGGTVARIYRNLGKLVGGKAGAGLIGLLYLVIAVRVLGPREYGVLILVHTFAMTVGGIVEFPGWHAVVRYGALAVDGGDDGRLLRLLRFATLVEGVGGLCAVATAAVLGPLIGPRLGWSTTAVAFAVPYSLAVLASVRATPAGLLQLGGRFDLLGLHVLVSPTIRLAGAAGIAVFGGGLRAFLVVWLVAALVEWASMWAMGIVVARRRLPGRRLIGSAAGARRENESIWRFMLGANADATFSDLAPRLAPLAVGWMLGPSSAALFAVAQRVANVIAQPAQLLGQAAYAELAHLVAGGGRGRGRAIRDTLLRSTGVALAVAVPALVVIGLAARPIARLIGGRAFDDAGGIMLLLAVSRLVLLAGPPASAALVALGRSGLSAAVNIGTALGTLPLLLVLLPSIGLAGAGLQAILQAVAAAALLGWCVLRESRRLDA